MTDESRESTEQGDVERTEEGVGVPHSAPGTGEGEATHTDGGEPQNAGERTAQEQKEGGFTHGEQEGPYGGGTESPGHDAEAEDVQGRHGTT